MPFKPGVAEKPSEIYHSLIGPLRPQDLLYMSIMKPHRKVELLRTIYGRTALEYAKHQYKLLTGETLRGNRANR